MMSFVSCLLYYVTCLMYPVSCIMSYVSCLMPPVTFLTSPFSYLLSHISCLQSHISCVTSPGPCLLSHDSSLFGTTGSPTPHTVAESLNLNIFPPVLSLYHLYPPPPLHFSCHDSNSNFFLSLSLSCLPVSVPFLPLCLPLCLSLQWSLIYF